MKEIKLLSSMEEGCSFDKCFGAYRTIKKGLDDIILVKNYKYRIMQLAEVSILNNEEKEYRVVNVENHDTHIVRPFDTLESISKEYGVNIEDLKSNNNLKNDKLFIGQILKV